MHIVHDDRRIDTITFSREANGKWKLLRYMNKKDNYTFADVDIEQSNDSIKIGLGFGYTGVSYYAKKDSV